MTDMEPNTSIMMVWSIAAMEAQALGWSKIEPEHMLCGALKFAELEPDELEQLAEATGKSADLRQHHHDLRTCLDEPWGILVPQVSTPLRRALRRHGGGTPNTHQGGMVHRSDDTRRVFREAQAISESNDREDICLVDLIEAILSNPDPWIRRGLDQHGVLSAPNLKQHRQTIEKWGKLIVPLQSSGTTSTNETCGSPLDPVVRVLDDILTKPGQRPCLLIYGSQRSAEEALRDLLSRSEDGLQLKITKIDSRTMLERFKGDAGFTVTSFLEFLTDATNQRTIWFFDSLHRYFSDDLALPEMRAQFVYWLKKVDGRFIFGIPESQYEKLIEQYTDMVKVFQLVWISDPYQPLITEL